VGRLIVSITLPSEVKARKETYERYEVDEACAEWVWEACTEGGGKPEECEREVYSQCPTVKKAESHYIAVIEGTGLVTKEGILPLRGLSGLTYEWWVEGEETRRPEVSFMTDPHPELDVPFKVIVFCTWREKKPRYYDLTLVFRATLSGFVSEVTGEARATTRVKFPRH
jgi:hypothetical protein